MENGEEVDFYDAYISTDTPDNNNSYEGSKDYIPESITLQKGDIVNVTFGVTESDGYEVEEVFF